MKNILVFLITLCIFLETKAQQSFPVSAGGLVDTEKLNNLPQEETFGFAAKLPKAASLKQFCPVAGDQGMLATCTGWSVAYGARTILYAKENKLTKSDAITKIAYDPMFLFNSLKGDQQPMCDYGVELGQAIDFLVEKGAVSGQDLKLTCHDLVTAEMMVAAEKHKIKGADFLFSYVADEAKKVNTVKEALAEGMPVVCNILTYLAPRNSNGTSEYEPSFWFVKDVWQPTETELDLQQSELGGPHNVVIVGYDDKKFGGSFEVMNSFGTEWGDHGFFWITYQDFYKVANAAFRVY